MLHKIWLRKKIDQLNLAILGKIYILSKTFKSVDRT